MLSLEEYLKHIGLDSVKQGQEANLALLQKVVKAHLYSFVYQNTEIFVQGLKDIPERTPTGISIPEIYKQFVTNKGGYCFQTNELLAWALGQLGFEFTRHIARSINCDHSEINEYFVNNLPYSHELILVKLDQQQWVVDVGFGSNSLRQPLLYTPGEQDLANDCYQLLFQEDKIRLEMKKGKEWFCLFEFQTEPKSREEIEAANNNLFLNPGKIPIRDNFLVLGKVTPEKRKRVCFYKEDRHGFFQSIRLDGSKKKTIETRDEMEKIAKKFDIELNEKFLEWCGGGP